MTQTPRQQYELLKKHRGLIVSMLSQFRSNISPEDMEELESSCEYAILRAADKYDEANNSGATFATYIRACINHEIAKYIKYKLRKQSIFSSSLVSLSTPIGDHHDTIEDYIADDQPDHTDAFQLDAAIASIHDPRRRDIVERIAQGETMRSIGRDHKIGRQRVFQIKEAGIEEMGGNVGRKKGERV